LAEAERAFELAQWAKVTAAGVYLDTGQYERAKPLLDAASKTNSADTFLRIHQAELAEASGQQQEALAIYQSVLERQADPEIHRRAFNLATKLERKPEAQEHFAAAESICRHAIDLGEAYSLETLANLYCDAETHASEALQLAERNLQYKFDRAAREALARVRDLQTGDFKKPTPIKSKPTITEHRCCCVAHSSSFSLSTTSRRCSTNTFRRAGKDSWRRRWAGRRPVSLALGSARLFPNGSRCDCGPGL